MEAGSNDIQWIFWVCAAVALTGGFWATFSGPIRIAALALWVCGLGVGGIFLSVGAEVLAVIQWIVSTLVGISFIFFSALFGDEEGRKSKAPSLTAVGVGVFFVWAIWAGLKDLPETPAWMSAGSTGGGLADIGRSLIEQHLLPLEILALTLFLVIVGAGVLSRPEKEEKEEL